MILLRDPRCPKHGTRYPKGSTCPKCRLDVTPGRKPANQRQASHAKPKKVQPFRCSCGRYVTNSQGICPGPDC